jgi:hypothetical protein
MHRRRAIALIDFEYYVPRTNCIPLFKGHDHLDTIYTERNSCVRAPGIVPHQLGIGVERFRYIFSEGLHAGPPVKPSLNI